jgi:2,3-bisphosphoglycerate-dependent phosphoglycerate mutase
MSRETANNILYNLFLARHGESTFNRDNRFTGWIDAPLTEKGREEANAIARKLHGHSFNTAYTSKLNRAIESLHIVLSETHRSDITIIENEALNERHYGDLQGLNKKETAQQFGEEQVRLWRRSFAIAPPNGESLKDTANRVLPFFRSTIMNNIAQGKNVLVLAHGNSLRTIVKEIERLSDEEILNVNIATGEVRQYSFDASLSMFERKFL